MGLVLQPPRHQLKYVVLRIFSPCNLYLLGDLAVPLLDSLGIARVHPEDPHAGASSVQAVAVLDRQLRLANNCISFIVSIYLVRNLTRFLQSPPMRLLTLLLRISLQSEREGFRDQQSPYRDGRERRKMAAVGSRVVPLELDRH